MKFWKRFTCVALLVTLLASPMQLLAERRVANEPSDWALRELFMAETYGLGSEEVFAGFTSEMGFEQFSLLQETVGARLGVAVEELAAPEAGVVTRGYVLDALYDAVGMAMDVSAADALSFYIENGLIMGRDDGNYALDAVCTTQEALIFAKRIYEYAAREMGLSSTGFLWKVSDEDNSVYLLGSIHVANYDIYPLSEAMMQAYAESVLLVVEVDLTDDAEMDIEELVMSQGFYHDGTTLQDVLDEETYALVGEVMAEIGLPEEVYNMMRPWYAELIITAMGITEGDAANSVGIDMFYMILALLDEKPIYSLESAALQIETIASMSEATQIVQLQHVLAAQSGAEGFLDAQESVDLLLAIWSLGDVEILEAVLGRDQLTDEASLEYFEKMNTIRNVNMIAQIDEMLKNSDQDVMVIVGALHMVYDVGIVAAMEELGYTVERLQ